MIVDVHTHAWTVPDHVDDCFTDGITVSRPDKKIELSVGYEDYMKAMAPCDRVITFGLRGRRTGLHVPNDHIASYVKRAGGKLIGFLSLDPNEPEWMNEYERGRHELGLRGVKLGPIYADFDPIDPKMDPLYDACVRDDMPIMIHVGTSFVQFGPLEYSRPILIDNLARRFPELRIVMAHMGHPWEGETIAVIRKHPNVYADISALHYRPWQFYHSMMLAQEYGVMHKILFGSDYPFTTPALSMEGLRNINRFCGGTALPTVTEANVEGIIARDAISLLWKDPP